MAIEAAIGVPAFGLFVAMIIIGGRVEIAKQSVEAAAYEAARAASIERTQSEAIAAGKSAATSSLHDQDVHCTSTDITVNAAAFNAPLGTTAQVTATVTCRVDLSDLSPARRARTPRTSPPRPAAPSTPTGSADDDRPHPQSRRRPRDERGAISVWFATASLVMIILVGMAVDLGGKVHTQQHARSVAAQAARTGAQEVQGSTAVRGEDLRVDITAAKSAAQDYLRAAGVEGTVTVIGGDTLMVTHHRHLRQQVPRDHRSGLDAGHRGGIRAAHPRRRRHRAMNTPHDFGQRLTGLLATVAVLGIVIGLPVAVPRDRRQPDPRPGAHPRRDQGRAPGTRRRHPRPGAVQGDRLGRRGPSWR